MLLLGHREGDGLHWKPFKGAALDSSVSHGRSNLIRPVLISNLGTLGDSITVGFGVGSQQ